MGKINYFTQYIFTEHLLYLLLSGFWELSAKKRETTGYDFFGIGQ